MKIINFILALIFLLFAFVQINDPDPILWILIYGNMAVLCVLAMFKMRFVYWLGASIIVYSIYAALLVNGAWEWLQSPDRSLLFDDIAKMQYPYIEETREFLGLIICITAAVFHLLSNRKKAITQ
jgi:Transmembrane family 220, helix